MLDRSPNNHVSAYDDDWADAPAAGWFPQWVLGVAVPLVLIGYGIACLVTGHGTLSGRGMEMELSGPKAAALGVASASLGTFLHCHYFWGNVYDSAAFAVLGKILSLVGLIGSLGYLIVRVGVLG